jgi:branched-subunit amino acid permease
MNLIYTVMFYIATVFLDYNVSKVIEEIGKFEASGSAVAITNSRHLQSL